MDGGATAKGGKGGSDVLRGAKRGGHSKIKSRKPWAGADEQS